MLSRRSHAVFVVLEVLDGTSWRVRDEFEDFQDKAGEGEDVEKRVDTSPRLGGAKL
jgi:hypothetical protein